MGYLASGAKPSHAWRIGTEHEKFAFTSEDLRPLPYEGERGIRALLSEMVERFDWAPILENGNVIALKQPDNPAGGNVSLEPGGQLELSGGPLKTVHQTCREVNGHLKQVRAIGEDLGIGFLGLGFQPKWAHGDIPMMPKGRYGLMKAYMPTVGKLGHDMMFRSCTIQVNLDYGDEADMVKKFRVSLALQPIATALFANSPFTLGKPNGFQSYRSEIWRDTDPDRTGMLPFVFEEGFGFERYVDYALDVPMYFVFRDGGYIDATGRSFRAFLDGALDVLPGERPTIADWTDHLSTIFPEVRLKQFLEMRGADGGPWHRVCALPSLWVGLLYDTAALDEAWQLVKDWSHADRQQLRDGVPRLGLDADAAGRSAHDIARDVLAIATRGLRARQILDSSGRDETQYLSALEQIVERKENSAQELVRLYETEWDGTIDPVFRVGEF